MVEKYDWKKTGGLQRVWVREREERERSKDQRPKDRPFRKITANYSAFAAVSYLVTRWIITVFTMRRSVSHLSQVLCQWRVKKRYEANEWQAIIIIGMQWNVAYCRYREYAQNRINIKHTLFWIVNARTDTHSEYSWYHLFKFRIFQWNSICGHVFVLYADKFHLICVGVLLLFLLSFFPFQCNVVAIGH